MDIARWLEEKHHLKIYIKPDTAEAKADTKPNSTALQYKYRIVSIENIHINISKRILHESGWFQSQRECFNHAMVYCIENLIQTN